MKKQLFQTGKPRKRRGINMSIQEIILSDCLERVQPPEQILRINVIDQAVFIGIQKYNEDSKGINTEVIAEISVSLPSLREALTLLDNDSNRENIRMKDKNGNLLPKIGGIHAGVT